MKDKKTTKIDAHATQSKNSADESKPQELVCSTQDTIAEEAFYLAEKRGFSPGYELQDWLEAESLVLAQSSL